MAKKPAPLTPVLQQSSKVDWDKGYGNSQPEFGAGKDQRYSLPEVNDLPSIVLLNRQVYRKADQIAQAAIQQRRIEMVAQEFGPDNPARETLVENMTRLAQQYPDADPETILGVAGGLTGPLADPSTPQPVSDQGEGERAMLNGVYLADVMSRIEQGTYRATESNPFPTLPDSAPNLGGVSALATGDQIVPDNATPQEFGGGDFGAGDQPDNRGFFEKALDIASTPVQSAKETYNFAQNALRAIPEMNNAAAETSAGNEQLISELVRRADMTVDQVNELFGNYNQGPFGDRSDTETGQWNPLSHWMTDVDPGALVAEAGSNSDQTIPVGDLSFEQAREIWMQHLQQTEQVSGDGGTTFGNITGRTTLGQQSRSGTLGEGGWFGGAPNPQEKASKALAERQSDIRPYGQRAASKEAADALREVYRTLGEELTLDEYTNLLQVRTFTEGRALTKALSNVPFMSPGSLAEMTVSGAVDTVFTLGTDPVSYIPTGVPSGAAKALVAGATRGRVFGLEQALAKSGDRLVDVGQKLEWGKVTRTGRGGVVPEFELLDPAGAPVAHSPRIVRDTYHYEAETGHRIVRNGRKWEVKSPEMLAGSASTATGPMFKTLKEAEASLTTKVRKVETWKEAGSSDPGKALDEVQEQYRKEYEVATGSYSRPVVTSQSFWDWMTDSPQGGKFTAAMVNNDSPYDIYLRSGGKFTVEQSRQLANATRREEVWALMGGWAGPDIRDSSGIANFVGVKSKIINGKMKLANSDKIKGMYRWSELAPNGLPVDLADPDDIIAQAHAVGTAMGISPEWMRPAMDRLIDMGPGHEAAQFLQNEFLEEAFWSGLRAQGVREPRIRKLASKIRSENTGGSFRVDKATSARSGVPGDYDEMAAMALEKRYAGGVLLDDSVSNGSFARMIDDEAALLGQEVFASHVFLPKVRDIRREVGRVAKFMHRNSGEDDDWYDTLAKSMSAFLDGWRNITLANTAYIIRSIGEEVFRMGISGEKSLLTNPIHSLATIIAVHNALDYASGGRKLQRAVEAARAATGAQKRATLHPEQYRGAKMVSTSALASTFGDPAAAAFTDAVGLSGRKVSRERFLRQTKQGIVSPLEITVDYGKGIAQISGGRKRLAAAEANRVSSVPVIVKPGKVDRGIPLSDLTRAAPVDVRDAVLAGERDADHIALFGASNVDGDLESLTSAARRAVDEQIARKMGLRYVMPYLSGPMARINGEAYGADLERAVRFGDNRGVSRAMKLTTMMNGSALVDEHPNKVLKGRARATSLTFDPSGKIDWTTKESESYLESVADSIADLASVREVRDLLSGAKTIDDLVADVVDDPKRLQDLLAVMSNNARESIARAGTKLPDGMTPEAMYQMHLNEINGAPSEAIRTYYQSMFDVVRRHMGNNSAPEIREVIVQGRYAGKALGSENRKFKNFLKDRLENNDDFRETLPPQMQPLERETDKFYGKLINGFFNAAGNMRDMVTLHPLLREVYVEEIVRLARYMDPDEYAKALKNVRSLGDDVLTKKLEKVTPQAEGRLGIEDAERLADKHARKIAEETFYHAQNRQNWAVALRLASPFAQAAANTTRRWGAAMVKDPLSVYRTVRNLEGMQDGIAEFVSGGNDPDGLQEIIGADGWLDQNQYGEDVFVYPMVGSLGSIFGAGLGGSNSSDPLAATATTKTVDLFGGSVVSTGPVVNFLLSGTPLRKLEARPDIYGDIVRFLEPYGLNQEGNLWTKAGKSFIPAKWSGLVLQDEAKVNQISKTILVSRLSRGVYGPQTTWTPEQSEEIRAEVNRDARTLIGLEAVGKLGLPLLGGFSFNPLIEMPENMTIDTIPEGKKGVSYLLPHMLQAEYNRYMKGAKNYDERQNRQAVFMRDWGDFSQFLAYGSTKSTSGITYSNPEAVRFAEVEPGLYEKYRDSIGYLFPGGDWDTEWEEFDQSLRARDKAKGVIAERTTAEQWTFLRTKALSWAKQHERKELELKGADPEVLRKLDDKYEELGLHQTDSGWTERHMANIERIVQDPEVIGSVQTARYVQQYMKLRRTVLDKLSSQDMATMASQEAQQTPEVQWLYATGSKAAAEDPGFSNFWEDLAVNEFIND